MTATGALLSERTKEPRLEALGFHHVFDFIATVFPILPQFLKVIIIININITTCLISGMASVS